MIYLRKRKGFMHAVEGVFAGLILLMYSAQIFSPPLQESNWNANILEQENREFLLALDKANITDFIIKNNKDVFLEVSQRFLGSNKIFSLTTENLVIPKISAAIFSPTPTDITNNINDVEINGRKIEFSFKSVSSLDDLADYDVLLIYKEMIRNSDEDNLRKFINQRKGIVEIADLSSLPLEKVQENIFNLAAVDGSLPSNFMFNNMGVGYESSQISKYFSNTSMNINIIGVNGILNLKGAQYNIIIIDSDIPADGIYDKVKIDSNNNGFDDDAELDENDIIEINGNSYKIKEIDDAGNYVYIQADKNHGFYIQPSKKYSPLDNKNEKIILKNGDYVAAIANFSKYSGKTIWMSPPSNTNDMDYWNFVRASILWISNKEYNFLGGSTVRSGSLVGTDAIFVSMGDMYIPYTVKFKMWY